MRLRSEVKVGLIVFIAMIGVIILYSFFNGLGLRAGTYPVNAVFDDVLRLASGAEVRMSGVPIGSVDLIRLTPDKKAKVYMRISRRFKDAIPEDSVAKITTGGLTGVGEYYIEISSGASRKAIKPGRCLRTAQLPKLDDLLTQVQDIVGGLQTSVRSVNEMLQNPEIRDALKNTLKNTETTTEIIMKLAADLKGLMAENRPELEQSMANVKSASEDFAAIGRNVRTALEHGGVNSIRSALSNAEKASENLEVVTQRLRKLAEDENLSNDIRQTISSAREAAEGAAEITGRLKKIIGPKEKGTETSPASGISGKGSRFDVLAKSKSGDLRVDYNLTLPINNENYFRIGIFDFGESNRLNAQLGRVISPKSALRYGLYASKMGIGYDQLFANDFSLQLDLYRLNDPALEAKLRYDFAHDWGVWIGVEDVFNNGNALFGLQYRR